MSKQSSGVNGFICHVWHLDGESTVFWDDLKTNGGAIRRALRLWPRDRWRLSVLKAGERAPLFDQDITCGGLLAVTTRHDEY